MPSTPPPPDLVRAGVLAVVERNGFVESVHHGVAVVLGADGDVQDASGPVHAPILPRSAVKPLQAVAMLRAGLPIDGPCLALACASHSGERMHLTGVGELLEEFDLTEADLRNTPDLPYDPVERDAWLRADRDPGRLVQNCSGKHAAMLATCRVRGWDETDHLDPAHPLQRLIVETVADLAGEPVAATAVDGCGAPALAISPVGLARAFGRIATAPAHTPEGRVAAAMRGYPHLVAGSRRDTTRLMRTVDGLICKDGAEAVHAVGLPDGRAVAVKIADGADRARPVVLAAALRRLGLADDLLAPLADAPVLGHGRPVGAIHATDW